MPIYIYVCSIAILSGVTWWTVCGQIVSLATKSAVHVEAIQCKSTSIILFQRLIVTVKHHITWTSDVYYPPGVVLEDWKDGAVI